MISYKGHRAIKDERDERRLFENRAWVGFAVIAALMLALLGRYVWLQIFAFDSFSTRSENNRVAVRPVVPNRGVIYDRRGRVIAENRPAYRLEVVPEKIPGKLPGLEGVLDELSSLVDLSEDDRKAFHKSRNNYHVFDSVPLKFNLSETEVARLVVNQHRFDGVNVVPYLSRHYPYGELLTHVVGYTGRLDADDISSVDEGNYRGTRTIGKIGIEKFQEKELHGVSGFERVETNVRGRVLRVLERQDAIPGTDLVLSLDVAVQQAAWDALGDRTGSVVAIDPVDGSVIALVSKPAYDPNAFVDGISQQAYNEILNAPGRPLFNRALNGGYEPGSTLKPFVGLAGLELELVTPETRVFSNGKFYIEGYDRPYRDWKDANELCELKKRESRYKTNSEYYQKRCRELERELEKTSPYEDNESNLEEERDFWRSQASHLAEVLDYAARDFFDSLLIIASPIENKDDTSWTQELKVLADKHGYEVPE